MEQSALSAALPPEVLAWESPVVLSGESRPPAGHERGFVLRLHADEACTHRLVAGRALVARRYDEAKADDLCPACTSELVRAATSSVVRRLRDAQRTLRALLAGARRGDRPVPREVVHCRALRYEAEQAVSVHPDVQALAAEVVDLAGEVAEALREALRRSLTPPGR